jgi:hypothetical protein
MWFGGAGVLGKLYDHVTREWQKFAAKAPAEPLVLDPDLVMEGREALMDAARAAVPTRHTRHNTHMHTHQQRGLVKSLIGPSHEQYKGYKREIAQALARYDKATEAELKRKHIDRISARYTDQFLKTQGTDDRLRQASAWYATHPITKENCQSPECRVGTVQVLCVLRGRGPHTVVPLEHDRELPELAQGHSQGPARAAQQSSAPGHLPELVLQHQPPQVGQGITAKGEKS